MVKKEFTYRGKTVEELKQMSIQDFMKLVPSRERRKLKRGNTDAEKILLKKIDAAIHGTWKKPIKTHCRDVVILPKMINLKIHIHNGKQFVMVEIVPDMVGHRLGEFANTTIYVKHNAPGIGATRSSAFQSVK